MNMDASSCLNVLVFSKTAGFRHESISASIIAIQTLAERSGRWRITASEDATLFSPSGLKDFTVIVLLQNTGNFLNEAQVTALQGFVRSGGGVVGIHAASAGLPNDDWYGRLIGVKFAGHPNPQSGSIIVESSAVDHPIVRGCGSRTNFMDEWYNFNSHPRDNTNLMILLSADSHTFQGGEMGEDHPISWYQNFENGRSYYNALGHFEEVWEDDWFLCQIEQGILWAAMMDESRA